MDKLFGQFSLQNFLRQMFCGIVFLLPFFLFHFVDEGETRFVEVCNKIHELKISGSEATCLFILALIIGTIIYHLEKNIWSYGLQLIRNNDKWWLCALAFALIPCVCMCTNCSLCEFINSFVVILAFVIAVLAAVISKLCASGEVVLETEKMWLAEKGITLLNQKELKLNGRMKKQIMSKVSTWSDFIHCGQSCAWAWILGSICVCIAHEGALVSKSFFWEGIIAATALLVAEAFIDCHRWQHVLKVTVTEESEKQDNIAIGCLIVLICLLLLALFVCVPILFLGLLIISIIIFIK